MSKTDDKKRWTAPKVEKLSTKLATMPGGSSGAEGGSGKGRS